MLFDMDPRPQLQLQRIHSAPSLGRALDPIASPRTLAYYGDRGIQTEEGSKITESQPANQPQIDTEQDRYPTFDEVLRKLLDEPTLPTGPIERLEVTTQANGDASCRVWAARAEEFEMVFYPGN